MKHNRFLAIIFLFFGSCIDPLQIPFSPSDLRLVVDGMITNEPGPYQVKLVYSSNLENSLRLPEPVSGATVSIVSSINETEYLSEISPGIYQSSIGGIHGQPGVSYFLKIVAASGEYQSETQTLVSAGSIDDVFFEFSPNEIINQDGSETMDAFKIYINSRGIAGNPNLYRWRWTGVFKVRSFPELYTIGGPNDVIPLTPVPWPCSGYVYQDKILKKISECECCTCWSYNYCTSALVSDNRFLIGNEFRKIEMGDIGITPMNFYERYYIEVEQLSVSEKIYDFWRLVESQQKALGSLFQLNAVRVLGNIKCISDPKEVVLGIFAVSGVTKKSIYINPEDVPYSLSEIDTIKYDCRTAFKNATTEKPNFW
jgi:hypothetical protein